jgi:hypothetical protein
MAKLTARQVEGIRSVIANLDGLQTEMSAAVKRKASEPVTGFQLKLINGVLAKANALLKEDKPFAGFTEFDLDDIPTAGDVSMVIAQYVESFEKLRCENIQKMYNGTWVWSDETSIVTVPPRARK